MIAAYLDESGIHDSAEVCVIAGYFGGRGQWRKFEVAWRKVLLRFAVPLNKFHAKDLMNRCGFFHDWNARKREQFSRDLADSIAAFKIHPVGQASILDDFDSFTTQQKRWFTGAVLRDGKLVTSGCPGKPYFMPFQYCVKQVAGYAPVGGRAHFFFGLDRPFAEYATILMRDLKENARVYHSWFHQIGDVAFPFAKDTPQLQAADFLVHMIYKDMLRRKAENNFGIGLPPPILGKCLCNVRGGVKDIVYHDKHTLQNLLQQTYADYGYWDKTELA